MSDLKNDLLLRALKGEKVERPPVWMMRQAGRYLPDYLKLKAKYDFFTRVQTPELATAITLQPIDQVGVDAAIIFKWPTIYSVGFCVAKRVRQAHPRIRHRRGRPR